MVTAQLLGSSLNAKVQHGSYKPLTLLTDEIQLLQDKLDYGASIILDKMHLMLLEMTGKF